MALAMEIFKSIGDLGKEIKVKNKDTSVVALLDRTINTLDRALKAMDKFLKNKGIDAGKMLQDTKDNSKSLIDKISTSKTGNKIGLTKGLIEKGKDIKSTIQDSFTKFTENNTAPPDEDSQGLLDKAKSFFTKKEQNNNPTWVDKAKERELRRKEEVAAEKKAVLANGKKKKKGGLLSSILSKIGSLGGLLSGAIWGASKFLGKGIARVGWWAAKSLGSGLLSVGKMVTGKLLSGLGGMFTKLIPGISGGIAKTMQSLAGKGLLGTAKLGVKGLLGAGKTLLPFAGKALGLAARGVGMLLTGPVGWAVGAATAGYMLYKLYKYLTRNNIAEDLPGKLHLLRLQTYGFGHNAKENYSKIFELEELMKENITFNAQQKKLSISKPTAEQSEKIYEIFGVSAEDKERRAIVGNWFSKRFIPAYHSFVQTLYGINTSIYLDDLEKLNPTNIQQFLMIYKVPGSIYSYNQIPYFEQPETTVTKKDIETTLESIKQEVKTKVKQQQQPAEIMAKEVASKKTQEKVNEIARSSLQKAGLNVSTKPTEAANNKPIGVLATTAEDAEAPPVGAALLSNTISSSSGKVTKAGGPLMEFDGTNTGIRTKLGPGALTGLDPEVRKLFGGMAKEYFQLTGKTVSVNEAFRSYAEQAALYRKYGSSGRAAPPGRSLHEFGLAIDINSEDTRELERLGLLRKYGFTAPVGGEPWHLEPIGVSLDTDKSKHDKNFRAMAVSSSIGKGGGGYGLDKNSKKYRRDIALQRSIFEGKVSESEPAKVTDPNLQLLANAPGAPATTGNTPTSTASSLVTTAEAKTNEANMAKPTENAIGGAVDLSSLMNGDITAAQEPETTVNTSSGALAAESMTKGSTVANNVSTTNPNMNLSNYGTLSPVEAIKQASKMTGVPEETLLTFGKLESSLRAGASASTSSAGGLFQFTNDTWAEQLGKHGAKYGLSPDTPKTDPLANALMAAEYAKANLRNVSGYEETGMSKDVALYLTHHFGPSGGKRLINSYRKNPNAPVSTAVSDSSYASNQAALGGKTISEYVSSLEQKFTVAKSTPASAYKGSGATAVASTSSPTPSLNSSSTMLQSYDDNAATSMRVSYNPTTTPVSTPTPTINQSAYDISRIEMPSKPSKTEQGPAVTVNTDGLELIMSNQLTTLTQIAAVLGTISDKLDMEKLMATLTGMSGSSSTPNQVTPSMKQVPHTGVNMGKNISA